MVSGVCVVWCGVWCKKSRESERWMAEDDTYFVLRSKVVVVLVVVVSERASERASD